MLKLQEDLLGRTHRTSVAAFNRHEDLSTLMGDISSLKKRIADQITLIQEMAWEAQDTAVAKAALYDMQETVRDWCAHRDLLVKLQTAEGSASRR